MQDNKPVLIVGLGNPGPEYKQTRHNVGFMAVDFLAGDLVWKKDKNSLILNTEIDGHKSILVKPQTYMNNSGLAVQSLMTFYKIPIENIIVLHDEMDLKVGDVRKKIGGGSAGHNGIKSIDNSVGREYTRIRIGVGHPRDTESLIEPADWVLGKFSSDELKTIKSVIENIDIFN